MHITLSDGTAANYVDYSAGGVNEPPLLLVHGGNVSLSSWRPWFDRLRGTRRIIAIDMPGHGDTAATRAADYTVDGMVAFLAAFVAAIGLNHPFVLAGHSMGGHVCWRYALKYPEHLAGLILMAAGGLANPAGGAQKAMSLARSRSGSLLLRLMSSRTRLEAGLKANVADPSVMTREMVDEWWSHSRREGVFGATLARYRAASVNPAMLARLGEIETPALIQWGRQDNVFPLALGEFMANEIPNAQLVTYEPCRHFPMLEHPQETARDADAFMRRLSSGDAASRGQMRYFAATPSTSPAR